MKATYGEVLPLVNSSDPRWMKPEAREIFKDPITDDGTKKSKKGLLKVIEVSGTLICADQCSWLDEQTGVLETVFKDSKMIKTTTLAEIRERLK